MHKEIKGALLSTIISILLPAIFTLVMTFVLGNQGEIIYSSILIEDKYINNITIKNMQKNEYLNNLSILINEEVDVKDNIVFVNGKNNKIEKNSIELKKIKPKEVVNISFETDKKIDAENLFLIKSKQKIGVENFNKKENLNIYLFILLGFYCVVNFIIYLIGNIKENKRYENYNKKLEKAEKSSESCEK